MYKKAAILQSNYIPWKGYFDLINSVDEFVLYDDMQFTKRDWRNRNRIKTNKGLMWLTIPVETKGKFFQTICDTKISNKKWNIEHWKSIKINHSKSKYFYEFENIFEDLYLNLNEEYLSQVNFKFIKAVCNILKIRTNISFSNEYVLTGDKTERLINICKKLNVNEYLTGPSARSYIDEKLFLNENIKLSYYDYSNYPTYEQLYEGFEHSVSILDLLFNTGVDAIQYMKSFKRG